MTVRASANNEGATTVSGGLFERLIGFVEGVQSAQLRKRAMNGTVAIRTAIAKQAKLDAGTLEILARQGPHSVRLLVANHQDLTQEVARILERYGDTRVKAVLKKRFGADEAASDVAPKAATPIVPVTPADENMKRCVGTRQSEPTLATPALEIPEAEDESADGVATTATESLLEPLLSTPEAPAALTEHDHTFPSPPFASEPDIGPEESFTTSSAPPAWAGDTNGLYEEIEQALDLLAAGTQAPEGEPLTDRYDEAAEIRLFEIFDKIPTGPAGEALLNRLAAGRHAPKMRPILELRAAGLDIEEISITWAVRDQWNESRTVSYKEFPLDYRTVGQLVHTFQGVPDTEEVLRILELMEQRWTTSGNARRVTVNQYIRSRIHEYVAAVQSGGHAPLEMLLN